MDIAALNQRVTFQKAHIVTGKNGNHRTFWDDAFTCWATIGSQNGTEKDAAGQTIPSDTFSVTVRWYSLTSQVTSDHYRIVVNGTPYNILSIDHLNYKKHAVKFYCQKEPAHG